MHLNGGVKQGYLLPSERDDLSAIEQTINVFVWDTITVQCRASEKAVPRTEDLADFAEHHSL